MYPAVAVLALAAAVPMMMPSAFVEEPSPRRGEVRVVSTSAPTPSAVVVSSTTDRPASDDRWWRAQVARVITTSSVVTLPDPPRSAPPPRPEMERVEVVSRGVHTVYMLPGSSPPSTVAEPRLSPRVPAQIRRWEPLILKASRKHGVDPDLIAALMMTESAGNPNAVGHAGANGLMQVLNGPMDPEANVDRGTEMIAELIKRFRSLDLALAGYNAGPNAVVKYGGVPPYEETQNHISRTLASYSAWK